MPGGAEGDPARGARRALTSRLGLLAGLALAGWLWTLHVAASGGAAGLFHDEGVYLVTGRALAEDATYRVPSLPDAPPAVRYPPLLPVALAAVWKAAPRFPDNLPLLKAIGLLALFGLVLALPAALAADGVGARAAGATALLTAIAPLTLRYATAVTSELPFACLSVLALTALARAARGRLADAVAAGVLAGLAFLTRSVGVALVVAGGLVLLRRAGRQHALAFILAAAPALVGWTAWLMCQRGHGGSPGYLAALLHDGVPGPAALLEHLLALPAAVAIVAVPGLSELLPAAPPLPALLAIYAVGTIALLAALRRPSGAYVGLTLAVAVCVPWFQPRFLVPLAPLFLAALLEATTRDRRSFALAATAVLLAGALAGDQARLATVRASGLPALEDAAFDGGSWSEVEDALAWLRRESAPADVVGTFHDPTVWLYTGRRAVQAYPALWRPDPAQVTAVVQSAHPRWLIDLPCPTAGIWAGAHAAWEAWLAAHAADLTPVYESASGRIRVWRVDRPLI